MQFSQIHHGSLVVQDLQRAATFYREALGLQEIAIPTTFVPAGLEVRWFQIGAQQIHLLKDTQPNPASPRHLALQVDDAGEDRAITPEQGLRFEGVHGEADLVRDRVEVLDDLVGDRVEGEVDVLTEEPSRVPPDPGEAAGERREGGLVHGDEETLPEEEPEAPGPDCPPLSDRRVDDSEEVGLVVVEFRRVPRDEAVLDGERVEAEPVAEHRLRPRPAVRLRTEPLERRGRVLDEEVDPEIAILGAVEAPDLLEVRRLPEDLPAPEEERPDHGAAR